MVKFNTIKEMSKFIYELDFYNGWKISSGFMNDRGKRIKGKSYYEKLCKLFDEKKLFRRKASVAEVVSWLDSLEIMRRVLNLYKSKYLTNTNNEISILMEYVIKHSKKMRIDYIIVFKKRILLIDFRVVDDFNKLKPTWAKKKNELMVYRELLENYLSRDFEIFTYAMINLFEYNNREINQKHKKYNDDQVNHLVEYINDMLVNPSRISSL